MKISFISAGAAGGKALIALLEKGIVEESSILLLNSTLKDIPENYRRLGVEFSGDTKGSGKERNIAKTLCLKSIQDGTLDKIDELIKPEDEMVVLVSSSEGGTGSGSIPVLAKYCKTVLGIPVMCFVFTGFEDDTRGLANSIEFFQDMEDEYTVQAISNKKFLEFTPNKMKAEALANEEFVKRMSVLLEKGVVDSIQNIDETDLFKVASTPGFMTVGKANLNKLKNLEQFNKILTDMVDEDVSLETEKSVKRLAVFINTPEATHDFIDYRFEVLREKLGTPYEVFTHIQDNSECEPFISFIASGIKMPLDELKEVYEKYKKESEKVVKSKDDFFSFASDLRGNQEDDMFNTGMRRKAPTGKDKSAFLNSIVSDIIEEPIKIDTVEIGTGDVIKMRKEELLKNNF